jgi:hypothetical protein
MPQRARAGQPFACPRSRHPATHGPQPFPASDPRSRSTQRPAPCAGPGRSANRVARAGPGVPRGASSRPWRTGSAPQAGALWLGRRQGAHPKSGAARPGPQADARNRRLRSPAAANRHYRPVWRIRISEPSPARTCRTGNSPVRARERAPVPELPARPTPLRPRRGDSCAGGGDSGGRGGDSRAGRGDSGARGGRLACWRGRLGGCWRGSG